MRVRFTSPALRYGRGEEHDLPEGRAKALIAEGRAVPADEPDTTADRSDDREPETR